MVLPQADRAVARGPRGLRRLPRLHRGDRLDRLAPDRQRAPPELHRRLQGDVVAGGRAAVRRRTSRPPTRGSTRPRRSSGREFAPLGTRAGTLRAQLAERLGLRDAGGGRGRATSTRSCRSRARACEHAGNVRDGGRDLDLRPRGRSRRGAPAGDHGRRARRHPARSLRLRGRAGGGRRHARVVRARRSPRPVPSTRRSSGRRPRSRPGRPASSRSTGGTATARSSPTPTSAARSSG